MNKELELLCEYLIKNGYEDDSKRVEEIMYDIAAKTDSDNAKTRLIAMCNPRYLGNLTIKEFDSVYEWWNFLADISSKAKSESSWSK